MVNPIHKMTGRVSVDNSSKGAIYESISAAENIIADATTTSASGASVILSSLVLALI